MSTNPKILAFAGSLRRDSLNKKLAAAAAQAAEAAGAEVTLIDLKDFPLAVYDQDVEDAEGLPDAAKRLKQLMFDADGFLISAPEYNSSITAALKNAIDWASRREEGEEPLQAFRGKVAALVAASPGGLGGLRGLVHVRAILGNIQVLVLPRQYALSNAGQAFDEQGRLTDEKAREAVEAIGRELADTIRKLKG